MEDINFNKRREFRYFLREAVPFPKKEQGEQGDVYRYGDLVIKDFRSSVLKQTQDILQFRDLEIPHFYFPKAGIYVKDKLKGCITEYADGNSVEFLDESIDFILRLLKVMESDLETISSERIIMKDINFGNVLVTEDHFNFIDTLFYCY